MPFVKFSTIDDEDGDGLIPDGWYRCRVAQVKETKTRNGSPMFAVRFEVAGGPHGGKSVWDNLVFSPGKAYQRLKMVCHRLGIDVTTDRNIETDDLMGKEAMVNVQQEEYTKRDGNLGTRNSVPFEGYELVDTETIPMFDGQGEPTKEASGDGDKEPLPF